MGCHLVCSTVNGVIYTIRKLDDYLGEGVETCLCNVNLERGAVINCPKDREVQICCPTIGIPKL